MSQRLQIWYAALYQECLAGVQKFLWKLAWPRSRDPIIFGKGSNISLKLLELQTSNLIHGFVWAMPSRRTNEFPWKWAWPRSLTPTIFGSTVGYPSDSLASCLHLLRYIPHPKVCLLQLAWPNSTPWYSVFLVVTGPLPTGHVTQRMRNGHLLQCNAA